VFYAAVQGSHRDPDAVWCLVVLMHWSRGYFNFTYKEMDDCCGPAEDDCPTRILDLLTPTASKWSNDWRERCRETQARRELASQLPIGTVIQFRQPFEFTNDYSVTRFLYGKQKRKEYWRAIADDGYSFACTLPSDWWRRSWTVTRTPSAVPA
jgi:hypothetical protein